ncbi:alcohol dehydrogenase AdhP [Caulobacter zeae]|uniref:alcohol dehydrogenase n=1 Tax=Caulobacter zeae TaxID=2055137 RepID=A0A2N5DRH3_9CAUL|nr:alcohol dehydrogenase AdhP [Caulobacter zeae]PLR28645.1 alcohol dehydrogenase AdhP [Caulobacter zeae]
MPASMTAAVVRAFGEALTLETRPRPSPGRGQVLVKIAACGVCHTDLHAARGDWPIKPAVPFVPGHEGVGAIVEVGEGVDDLKIGDRVGVPWLHSACGRCDYCLSGWETLCAMQSNTGYSVDGGFADYVLADAAYVGRIPDSLSFLEAAPILCAGVTVYKGLKVLQAKPGDWVAISGIGGLGHLAVQYGLAMGFKIAAVDIDEAKLDLARSLGARVCFNAADVDPGDALQREIGGAHGVLVTAVSLSAFTQALAMVRRGGTVSLNGLPPGDFPLSIFDTVLRGVTVRGSIVGTRLDLEEALSFAADGKVRARIQRHVGLADINAIFEDMAAGRIEGRAVLDLEAVQ